MAAFRHDDELNEALTPDDRVEIFLTVLQGGSDVTKGLLDELLAEYEVTGLEVTEQ